MSGAVQRMIKVFRAEGMEGVSHRVRQRYHRALYKHAKARDWASVPSAYGVRMAANWTDSTFRFCVTGAYGIFLSSFIKHQRTPFCFLDIGSNQGLYAILAAQTPTCRKVYAFEPVPQTADLLARNIALNGVEGACHLVRKAISDQVGRASISLSENHSGAAAIGRELDGGQHMEIETINAQALAQEIDLGAGRILVKVDVEGHEDVVIRQLLKTPFAGQIEAIFYECDETWVDVDGVQRQLEAAGFQHFKKIGQGRHYDILASRT